MKTVLSFLVIFGAFALFTFGMIQLDLFLNPWVRNVVQDWRWYNYFTNHHTLTALYLKGWLWWLIPSFVISIYGCYIVVND